VNATGNWPYFLDDGDRVTWLRLFVKAAGRYDWRAVVFCQMTTHVHAMVRVGDASLAEGMRYLNREYSKDSTCVTIAVGNLSAGGTAVGGSKTPPISSVRSPTSCSIL
jgi:hypothetical protein